ncbi:Mut7-C RNAse domain-containing protein [Haladaptatus halobius]|jgi:uncharacterized protein|uniref:Mut7-C RNAse domain-containing protein n=1 Tax=Haladaptatus halobius TaxID=2884875 RepID=UPI001D0AD5AE|nr:Mut7-C RNAse domain-containing protein [Haladaptatus halobius]
MALFLDVMLGKLTTYLRMCGYDAAYALDRGIEDDDAILEMTREEGRTLVTRDEELAARTDDSILVESLDVTDQLRELRGRGLDLSLSEPARCSDCNGTLVREAGRQPDHAPDEKTVWRCRDCGKRFWKGSHWASVERTLEEIRR